MPAARSRFGYPMRALMLDYAGGGAGLVVTLGPLGFVPLAAPVAWLLTALAALFLVYFGRTVCRQLTHIELDAAGIRVKGPAFSRPGAAIRWENLRSLCLEYYSTRADPEGRTMRGGWMQLKLADAQRTIRIDSDLDGFEVVARRAASEAARLGLALEPSTLGNLQALGG